MKKMEEVGVNAKFKVENKTKTTEKETDVF
jgi:hypothetical protein